jgi:hypothetical protein
LYAAQEVADVAAAAIISPALEVVVHHQGLKVLVVCTIKA